MKEIRVGILINSFNLGGAEKLMIDVASAMSKKDGIKVFLISMKAPETEFEKELYKKLVCDESFRVRYVGKTAGKRRIKAIFKIAKLIKILKLDILHTNGPSPDFYGRLAKIIVPKCKVIVTIHSASGYNKKIERLLGCLTYRYTAVSEAAREYAIKELGIKKDVSVITNGVVQKKYENDGIKERRGKSILSVGRVMPQKNYIDIIDEMAEYLRKNTDAKWSIVGDITQDKDYVEAIVQKIPQDVKDRIKFTGAVANAGDYYKNADCFILPSEFEGFGLVYAEAMLAGLPVIAKNVGIIPEIIEKGGHVVILDKLPLADAIDEALGMSEVELIENKNICMENYSIDATTCGYIEIYKS